MLACRFTRRFAVLGLVALLLGAAGCGCTDDSGGLRLVSRQANAQIGLQVAPIRLPAQNAVVKVDVMFLLDDSLFVTKRTTDPGQTLPIGAIPGDGRIKTDVAQGIFADAVQKLEAQLVADGLGQASDFDLAFGVSRFEDYANFPRSMPKVTDPSMTADPVDGLARPFILNQPILRQAHPLFATLFASALSRETPGDGGQDPQDPQAALEALYQLATGAGFDGDNNGSTQDSGPVGELSTQLTPGTSGDVPAFSAALAAPDPDGEPVYSVGGTVASGNGGGAGWRPDSIRLIVMFTDIATVAPLMSGVQPDAGTGLFVYPISNTPSAAGQGPRPAETIQSVQAFAAQTGTADEQAMWRFGVEDGTIPVAPVGAATLENTISALNSQDVEVLGIGLSRSLKGGPTKPNLPPPTLPGEVPAVQNPSQPPQDDEAFTYLSAVAILTGARDTDATDTDPRFVTGLPLVYNLTTLSPLGGPITSDLVEDLSDRVGAWLPFKQTTMTGGDAGSAFYTFTLSVNNPNAAMTLNPDPGFALVPDVDPGGSDPIYVSQSGATQIVRIPRYFDGDPVPDPVRVAFQVSIDRTNPEDFAELLADMTFSLTPVLTPAADVGGENPTGVSVAAPTLTTTAGTIHVDFPEIPANLVSPDQVPLNAITLTDLSSGEALFRDLERSLPAGTSIDTMAGPLEVSDLPYPP